MCSSSATRRTRLDCMGMSGVLVYRNNKSLCSRKPAISQEPVTYSGSVW
jgi:hypothetical protein